MTTDLEHQCRPPNHDELKHGTRWRCTCGNRFTHVDTRDTDGEPVRGWLEVTR